MLNSASPPTWSTSTAWQTAFHEIAGRPGLSDRLTRPASDLFLRFGEIYDRLVALPRARRRRLQRRLGVGLAGVALLLTLGLAPGTALAATITVNGAGAGGTCSLTDAITAANTDTASGNCPAGSGADTIDLQTGVNLTAALPDITTAIVLQGHRNAIQRTGGDEFSVLRVTFDGDLTLNQVTISGGSAISGGGIYNANGTLKVQECTLSGNSAVNGGGIYNGYGTLNVRDSTLSGNIASMTGGGIDMSGGTVTVENSTLSGNSANQGGGGINTSGGVVTVQNSTLSGNFASNGGGIYNTSGTVTVQNSIIALQTYGEDCAGYLSDIYSDGYNIESGWNCLSLNSGPGDQQGVTDGSLRLGSLGDHGGSTETHDLSGGSVAIDQIPGGANDGCVAGVSIDQRGSVRAGGASRGGSACDIGAYEYDSLYNPTAVTLRGLAAAGSSPGGWLAALGVGLVAGLGGLTWRRRRDPGRGRGRTIASSQ